MNTSSLPGRNDPCPCGSGKKYKRCCLVPGADLWSVPTPAPEAAAEEDRQLLKQEQFLKQAGVDTDTIQDLSPEGIQRWIDEQMHDPAKKAVMEAALADHPEVAESATERLHQLHDDLLELLEHHPEGPLLSMEELEPWLAEFVQQLDGSAKPGKSHWWSRKSKPTQPSPEEFNKVVRDVTERMAVAIFTLERVGQLRQELQDFAQMLDARGEEDESMLAREGLLLVPPDATSANCDFLVNYGFRSMRVAFYELQEYAQQNPTKQPESNETAE